VTGGRLTFQFVSVFIDKKLEPAGNLSSSTSNIWTSERLLISSRLNKPESSRAKRILLFMMAHECNIRIETHMATIANLFFTLSLPNEFSTYYLYAEFASYPNSE
jgi:hypothetical protein